MLNKILCLMSKCKVMSKAYKSVFMCAIFCVCALFGIQDSDFVSASQVRLFRQLSSLSMKGVVHSVIM